MKTMNAKLRFFLDVLFFGSVWGILEATLGTVLHLPVFDGAGIYMASSTIIIPLAYVLMANCYKKTNSLAAVALMGVIASTIKLSVAFVLGFIPQVYNPAIYILIEASAMVGALAIFRPKNVLSLRTLAVVIVANTTYQFSYLVMAALMGSKNAFVDAASWANIGEKYLFKINCVAILYLFVAGAITYGIVKLLESKHVEVKFDYKKVLYSPITAAVMFTVAVGITITFAAVF